MTDTKIKASEHVMRAILNAVRSTPGIRADALAKEVAIHTSTLSNAGRILCERGQLMRERVGRSYHYRLPDAVKLMIPSDIRPADIVELAELDAIREELESLRAEVKDLRAFKERALAVHPDLGVDPLVLEAREIAHRILFDADKHVEANNILFGYSDDTAIVKATIEALRRAAGAE
jgi:hypothetical protein